MRFHFCTLFDAWEIRIPKKELNANPHTMAVTEIAIVRAVVSPRGLSTAHDRTGEKMPMASPSKRTTWNMRSYRLRCVVMSTSLLNRQLLFSGVALNIPNCLLSGNQIDHDRFYRRVDCVFGGCRRGLFLRRREKAGAQSIDCQHDHCGYGNRLRCRAL